MASDLVAIHDAIGLPQESGSTWPEKVHEWVITVDHKRLGLMYIGMALVFLLIATTLEVSGDAVVRMAIYDHAGPVRVALFLAGAVLLLGYGSTLNLAPFDFGRVVGLYIATLFIVWQFINLIAFRAAPSLPVLIGGTLIVAGGLLVTFWQPGASS